jgi:ribosomal-protein-alanine N-acetyltransferase
VSAAGLVLERAGDEDLDALVTLERRCFSHPWTPRNFQDEIAGRGRVVVLRAPPAATSAARGIVAYCVYHVVADEMHVLNLAVHAEHRGRGLARRLLALCFSFGARQGARRALLEVRQSNRAAQRLYSSMGFAQVSVRRNYYSHPREDAMVLEKGDLGAEALCRSGP